MTDEEDDDTVKTSGTTVGKAGKDDDAAKTYGKAVGKAGQEDYHEDEHPF